MLQKQRTGIAPPPLLQPQLQRQSGCDRQFLWLRPLSFPQTLNRYSAPSGRESPQTPRIQDPGSPTRGTPVPIWPRQVSPSAALGTSPLPLRPPCSSAWSSPPSTCPAVQVIVLSFFLGHLGKGRAGLRGREGFLGPGWPCTGGKRKQKFPWRIRQGTPGGSQLGCLGFVCHTLNSFARIAAGTRWSLPQRKKCRFVSISLTMGPNW